MSSSRKIAQWQKWESSVQRES